MSVGNHTQLSFDSFIRSQKTHKAIDISTTQYPELRFIDLFAGIGGIRLGLESYNCRCVFSSEWDKFSQQTYLANFGEMPFGDITKIESKDIPDHDILSGGFPCQAFSIAGKRLGFDDTRGTLFFEIARILNDKKPRAFLLENVANLARHDKGRTFQVILNTLNELGYYTETKVLNASDFGLPQHRRRVYLVGFRKDLIKSEDKLFGFPKGNNSNVFIGEYIEDDPIGYAISKHLQKVYIHKKDDGKPQIVDSNSTVHAKTLVASYHKIQRLTSTFVKGGETGLRMLSQNECKAMMGFPLDYKIPVSRTQMYRQFGNSVAVPVIKAIANNIIDYIYSNME